MKIAFSGPSGLGKTTQCKYVNSLGIPWHSTSAGDILSPMDKAYLGVTYGYKGTGHKDVIKLSINNPEFGFDFQDLLLRARGKQILDNKVFVIDRCPIDNVAYLLSQASPVLDEEKIRKFITSAQEYYLELTHVIRVQFSPDISFIEYNGSRIASRYFQTHMSDVFNAVYVRYFANLQGPRVMTLDHFNLKERYAQVKEFIYPSQLELAI